MYREGEQVCCMSLQIFYKKHVCIDVSTSTKSLASSPELQQKLLTKSLLLFRKPHIAPVLSVDMTFASKPRSNR